MTLYLVSSLFPFPSNEALREGVAGEGWLESGWRVDSRVRRGAFIPEFIVLVIRELSLIRENIKQRPSPAQSEPESPSDASYLYIDIVLSGSAVSGAIGMEFGQKVWPIRGKYYRLLTSQRGCDMVGMLCRDAPNYCPDIEECSIKERLPWVPEVWQEHDTSMTQISAFGNIGFKSRNIITASLALTQLEPRPTDEFHSKAVCGSENPLDPELGCKVSACALKPGCGIITRDQGGSLRATFTAISLIWAHKETENVFLVS